MPGPTKFEPTEKERALAQAIREGRAEAGLSQEDLAVKMGISTRSVYRIEKAQRPVSIRDAKALGAALRSARETQGITRDELSLRSGVSRNTIVRYEQGLATKMGAIDRIANELGIPLTLDAPPDEGPAVPAELAMAWRQADEATRMAILVLLRGRR